MQKLLFCFVFVILKVHVSTSAICSIGSFVASVNGVAQSTTDSEEYSLGDVVTLTCKSSSSTCIGIIRLSGTELNNDYFEINTAIISQQVELKTSGKHVYECSFQDSDNNLYGPATLSLKVKKDDCTGDTGKMSVIWQGKTTYTVNCKWECFAMAEIIVEKRVVASTTNVGGNFSVDLNLEETKTYEVKCKLTAADSTSTTTSEYIPNNPCSLNPTLEVEELTTPVAYINQTYVVNCDSSCSDGTIALARSLNGGPFRTLGTLENQAGLSVTLTTGPDSNVVSLRCETEHPDGSSESAKSNVVTAEVRCLPGQESIDCGTKCGSVLCSSAEGVNSWCLGQSECVPKCRCPSTTPFWSGSLSTHEGECVAQCDTGSEVLGMATWAILCIVVGILLFLLFLLFCVYKVGKCLLNKPNERPIIKPSTKKKPQPVQKDDLVEDPIYESEVEYAGENNMYMEADETIGERYHRVASMFAPPAIASAPPKNDIYHDPVEGFQLGDSPPAIQPAYDNIGDVRQTNGRRGRNDSIIIINRNSVEDGGNLYENQNV